MKANLPEVSLREVVYKGVGVFINGLCMVKAFTIR
jgi:hypothetical protein